MHAQRFTLRELRTYQELDLSKRLQDGTSSDVVNTGYNNIFDIVPCGTRIMYLE
jgi:hypothetical protein